MGQTGEIILGFGLPAITIVDILRERMDGVDRAARRPSLKERLGLKGLGCCGPTWGLGQPTTMSVRDDDEVEQDEGSPQIDVVIRVAQNSIPIPPCTGMNLAAALAAERQLRAALDSDYNGGAALSPDSPSTASARSGVPSRVSLMRLLEETDEERKEEDGGGCDSVCCVCMGRRKGAAFIPCGHTFCRVCSREVWLNRGCCPLCNRSILEILDIY